SLIGFMADERGGEQRFTDGLSPDTRSRMLALLRAHGARAGVWPVRGAPAAVGGGLSLRRPPSETAPGGRPRRLGAPVPRSLTPGASGQPPNRPQAHPPI